MSKFGPTIPCIGWSGRGGQDDQRPTPPQNFMPVGFSCWHRGHCMPGPPNEPGRERSDRWRELSLAGGRGQERSGSQLVSSVSPRIVEAAELIIGTLPAPADIRRRPDQVAEGPVIGQAGSRTREDHGQAFGASQAVP
jgi:hypothetical protein